ncbi:NUDIX domain-containing protein [Paenibacillus phoenicis]|uniref:NUDIX domain-containing protein n=1 Tax=Paenibacillus phoenicis TaxID=554117 RepID=A0ABU5PHX0_9BACL|nr:NUDIX domain-containing protein [Paenibacillus phoenicis]MEA3569535.1 NUDIX domain-containing protein [Paenibacillus phoenicis]
MEGNIDKIAWIRLRDGRMLNVRSKGKELFYVPGGKREPGESDHETLQREIQEELSVTVKPDSIKYFATFEAQADGKPEGVLVRMTCYFAEVEGELQPANEIEEAAWLSYAERDRTSLVSRMIFDKLHEMNLL